VPTSLWHRLRKRIHLACFLIFLALPFLNIVRFDIPRQRFYFFGAELWINEFGIIFFALMFLMFLIVISSVFFGRVYCSYLCPQMIFSEASMAVESWWKRRLMKRFPKANRSARALAARALFLPNATPRLGLSDLRIHLVLRRANRPRPAPARARCPHRRRHCRTHRNLADLRRFRLPVSQPWSRSRLRATLSFGALCLSPAKKPS